jgi:hypothetical protein
VEHKTESVSIDVEAMFFKDGRERYGIQRQDIAIAAQRLRNFIERNDTWRHAEGVNTESYVADDDPWVVSLESFFRGGENYPSIATLLVAFLDLKRFLREDQVLCRSSWYATLSLEDHAVGG